MARKRFTVEQIIGKLREAEVAIGKGLTVPQAARQIGVTEQTYYRWRRWFGAFGGNGGVPRWNGRRGGGQWKIGRTIPVRVKAP